MTGQQEPRPIRVIASDVMRYWRFPPEEAARWASAMLGLEDIAGTCEGKPGTDIVRNFLWQSRELRGKRIRRARAELSRILAAGNDGKGEGQ